MAGKIDRTQTDKIFVEKYDGKEQKEPLEVVIDADNLKTGVFVGNCKGPNLAIVIKGKLKNLTISNCTDIAVVIDDCITTVEVIGCKKVAIQANSTAGSYVIDKCDRTTLYLPATSLADKVVCVSCMSTCTNVVCPGAKEEDDSIESAIPDQIQSTFKTGAAAHHCVVIPDAE
jgi:hypothetical protein